MQSQFLRLNTLGPLICVRNPRADLTREHMLTLSTVALICVYKKNKKTLPLAKLGFVRSSELGISKMPSVPSRYEKKIVILVLSRIQIQASTMNTF